MRKNLFHLDSKSELLEIAIQNVSCEIVKYRSAPCLLLGAVHKRRHQFFEIFDPPPPPFVIIFTK